jgi:hypothetical protein
MQIGSLSCYYEGVHLLCIGLALLSANNLASQKVLLKFDLAENQRFEYQGIVTISGENLGNFKGTFHRAERIVSSRSGDVVQSVFVVGVSSVADGKLMAAKTDFDKLANKKYPGSFHADGRPLDGKKVNQEGAGTIVDLIYSDQPVEIGDTWTGRIYQGDDTANVKVDFRLLQLSDTEATIEAQTEPNDKLRTTDPFRFVVDRKSGKPKYVKGTLQAMVSGLKIDIKYEMKMIVPVQTSTVGRLTN